MSDKRSDGRDRDRPLVDCRGVGPCRRGSPADPGGKMARLRFPVRVDREITGGPLVQAGAVQCLYSDRDQSGAQHSCECSPLRPLMALSPLTRRMLCSLAAVGGALLSSLAHPHPAFAESIRVLLAQEAPFVEVRSDGDLALTTEMGEMKLLRSPIHIASRGDGLHVNGRRMVGGQVVIRPLRNTLSLVIGKDGGTVAGSRLGSAGQSAAGALGVRSQVAPRPAFEPSLVSGPLCRINWANPITRGLRFAFNGADWVDLVTGTVATQSGSPYRTVKFGVPCTRFDGATSDYLDFLGTGNLWNLTGPISVLWRGSFDAVAGGIYRNLAADRKSVV